MAKVTIRSMEPEDIEPAAILLGLGALFVLGLAFLAGYSTIFLAAAAIAASFRKRSSNEAGEKS